MFPIDTAALPSLATRKALLIVDAQNDFLAEDGALPITIPYDLSQRISNLANDFRRNGGEIIWVQSQFEVSRPIEDEQILISNVPSPSAGPVPRGRRPRTTPPVAEQVLSPEAFLTPDPRTGPVCVRPGAPGTEMPLVIRQAVGPKDSVLTKTFYSAFNVEELLRVLRVKFVTELFICGSLTNIGVMATAIDAARYGYTITIVDDCCGAQSMLRHRAALRQITSTTGCETLSAARVVSAVKPKPKPKPKPKSGSPERADSSQQRHRHRGGTSPTVRSRRGKRDAVDAPSASDIQPSFERLSLSGESAAAHEHASTSIAPSQARQQSESEPQSQSRSALQPVARSGHSQAKVQTNRDTVTAASDRRQSVATNHEAPPDGGRHDSDESSLTPSRRKSQQSTISLAELKPHGNTNEIDTSHVSSGVNVNKEQQGRSKGVESSSRTTDNARSSASSKEESESLENSKSPTLISTMLEDNAPLCEGDTKVIYNILPADLSPNIFTRVRAEVSWLRMSHQGGEVPRLVAVQGHVDPDGSKPVYRHPADESPPLYSFTPAVDTIRNLVEAKLGHPLNHVLIQLYRGGTDYISEHSDKTLDIARGSFIANVSLGAERTMTLRTKRKAKARAGEGEGEEKKGEAGNVELKSAGAGADEDLKRQIQRARLPHNSLFQMGLATNARWLHGIRQDKRAAREKEPAELDFDGARISLTFRQIGTFLDSEEKLIWGQGAVSKTRTSARPVVNGLCDDAIAMLKAFGRENQDSEFDWEENYGRGFDVLHITAAKRLFLSADSVVSLRLRGLLAEFGVAYAKGSVSGAVEDKFVDNDEDKTVVLGERDIMLYVEKMYGGKGAKLDENVNEKGAVSERFEEGLRLLDSWRSISASFSSPPTSTPEKDETPTKKGGEGEDTAKIKSLLSPWEKYAAENTFIAGPEPSLADFTFWPVLHDILSPSSPSSSPFPEEEKGDGKSLRSHFPHLSKYNTQMRNKESIAQILDR
ncbi:hypothetical protein F4678DRAFT_475271 [Xylaria arbuscula]|nr:hypothetical protein F4678DRAFT_475271 [Xylaria arbuscula]